MAIEDEVSSILDRITSGQHTEEDIVSLRQLLNADNDRDLVQVGKNIVNIGQVHGGEFQIGDRIYQGADAETLRKVFQEVLQQQNEKPPTELTGADGLGVLSSTVPQRPLKFLPRPDEINSLKTLVLGESNQIVAVTGATRMVGVQGMGGIGKSVLAAELARVQEVRRRFRNGIVWVTVGQTPILPNLQALIVGALTGEAIQFKDVQEGKIFLGNLLKDKACLLILDDVWDLKHAEAFTGLSLPSQIIITTRNIEIIEKLGSQEYRLDLLSDKQALELLAQSSEQAVETLSSEAQVVAQECGNLPLALAMVGAMAKGDPDLWSDLLAALRNADLEDIEEQFPNYVYPNLLVAIKVSVDALQEQKEYYLDFAIFPEDTPIPEAVLQTLWQAKGLNSLKIKKIIKILVNRSLAQQDQLGRLTLHDLQLDYVRKQVNNLPELQEQLLQAYQGKCANGWATGPKDGYFFQQLGYHLVQANRQDEFRQLLLNFDWLQSKLEATNTSSLIADFYKFPEDEELRLVQQAILLSLIAIAQDPKQLWSQLYGRLMSQEMPGIKTMLAHPPQTRWLRPLAPSLHQASGLLRCTLQGHENGVDAVAITPNGRLAVSASRDNTLRVWDLDSGSCLHTLQGHKDWVNAVTITPNGRLAVSASRDNTLRMWDLDSGSCLNTLQGHKDWVNAVTITPNGRLAVSASRDNTLRVWDLDSGSCLHTLQGHKDWVNAVTITPNGRLAVSASRDNTLRVWDLDTSSCLYTLNGHDSSVYAVAITPDGRLAVSASWDATPRVWDLHSRSCLHILNGHDSSVYAVAITPNGRLAVSASGDKFKFLSNDKTLRVWDLDSGSCLHTLNGHEDWVNGVAITPDGQLAVSASEDKTLRVWDLDSGSCLHTLNGHDSSVNAVVITPYGQLAVSASEDNTLRVWNLRSWSCLHTLNGHENWVNGVAITPEGRLAVSASGDNTLRVWDLHFGNCLHTLNGHEDSVYAVAITPDGRHAVSVSSNKFTLSSSRDKTLRVWDLHSGSCLHTLNGHEKGVDAVAITPNGRLAVSASEDKTLRVWDLDSGSCLHILEGHKGEVNAVGITPDGRHAVSASYDKTLRVWDLDSGSCLHILNGHEEGVDAVAITPNGRWAVSASYDKTLRVWDLDSGSCLHILEGHKDEVNAVGITPDERHAVSASRDKTLRVWDLQSGSCLHIWTGDSAIICCAISPDGVTFMAGELSGRVHLLRWEELN